MPITRYTHAGFLAGASQLARRRGPLFLVKSLSLQQQADRPPLAGDVRLTEAERDVTNHG